MPKSHRLQSADLVLAVGLLACCSRPAERSQGQQRVPSALAALAQPSIASPFRCQADGCRQEHPRLPDAGEWRCADGGSSVWCAGGQASAGVVAGPIDPRYLCGKRWSKGVGERICIDPRPDFPASQPEMRACAFEQERGNARVCRPGKGPTATELPPNVTPACWIDRDCPSATCDRGACRCRTSRECELGSCQAGLCVETSG